MAGTMTPYIVRQGDYLAKLAFAKRFDADEVWNDPKNEELKKLRPDPNILAPGDILYLPEPVKVALPIEKGVENTYAATVPKVTVVLVFMDGDKPLANEPYEVQGLDDPALEKPLTTDGDGKLTLNVPVTTREVSVTFPGRDLTYAVRVGDMDPVEEASGIKKRLYNLGYVPGFADEEEDDDSDVLASALTALQAKHGLDPTGKLDEATQEALVAAHKS